MYLLERDMVKYQEIYDSIINKARTEDRKKLKRSNSNYIYYENHHIIPDHFFINNRSKGRKPGWLECNPEDPSNKILLTGREHFIAHQLLIKIYPEHKYSLISAAQKMTVKAEKQQGRSKNKLYGWMRELFAEAISKLHTGRKRPKITGQKISKRLTGIKRTQKTKDIIKIKRQNQIFTEETRKKMSEWQKNKPKTTKTKERMSLNSPGQRAIECIELNMIFQNSMKAAKFFNIKYPQAIRNAAHGHIKSAGGYTWRFIDNKITVNKQINEQSM